LSNKKLDSSVAVVGEKRSLSAGGNAKNNTKKRRRRRRKEAEKASSVAFVEPIDDQAVSIADVEVEFVDDNELDDED
jgi:hypothetical protein